MYRSGAWERFCAEEDFMLCECAPSAAPFDTCRYYADSTVLAHILHLKSKVGPTGSLDALLDLIPSGLFSITILLGTDPWILSLNSGGPMGYYVPR